MYPHKKLLVAGYINMDLVAYVPEIPQPGERLSVPKIEAIPGGMAANCACAAAKLGANVEYFGGVGNDEYGMTLIADLQTYGVGIDYLDVWKNRSTTRCLIYVTPSGERCIISESFHFNFQPLKQYLSSPKVMEAACLHLDGYQLESSGTVLRTAHEKGITVSVDLDGLESQSEESIRNLQEVDIAFMNRTQMLRLTGESTPQKALVAISRLGPQIIIATLGTEGACLYKHGHWESVAGYTVDVCDTIGAGDTFDGAFLAHYIRTHDARMSLQFANAAAALSVAGQGARNHLPTVEDVLKKLKNIYGAE